MCPDIHFFNIKINCSTTEKDKYMHYLKAVYTKYGPVSLPIRCYFPQFQQGNVKLQQGNINLQQDNVKLQQDNVKLQQDNVNLQQGNVNLQQDNVNLQQDNVKLQQGNVKLQQGNVKPQYKHYPFQVPSPLERVRVRIRVRIRKTPLFYKIFNVRQTDIYLQVEYNLLYSYKK